MKDGDTTECHTASLVIDKEISDDGLLWIGEDVIDQWGVRVGRIPEVSPS